MKCPHCPDVTLLMAERQGIERLIKPEPIRNDHTGPAVDGAFAKTPMIRFEYHF